MEFATSLLRPDLPAPIDSWSRLVVQDGGPLVLAALESGGSTGPWAVVDGGTAGVDLGRGLAPVADGRLGAGGDGLLLTHRGLTAIATAGGPRVLGYRGAGLGTGKDDHEQCLEIIDEQVAVVGRWFRPRAKLVRVSTGEVIGRLSAQPPFLAAAPAAGTARLWALGSGSVLTFDTHSWRMVDRSAAPRALAACWTPHGAVAVLGSVDPRFREGAAHALLRDVAPRSVRRRLRSPFTGLRLALLDERFHELASAEADWLWTALPDPDPRGVARLAADSGGRAVLTTAQGLSVIDPTSLQRLGEHRSGSFPATWAGASRAVYCSGERELTVVDWTAQRPSEGRRAPETTMG